MTLGPKPQPSTTSRCLVVARLGPVVHVAPQDECCQGCAEDAANSALPGYRLTSRMSVRQPGWLVIERCPRVRPAGCDGQWSSEGGLVRSEEHTSELQSLRHLVCR